MDDKGLAEEKETKGYREEYFCNHEQLIAEGRRAELKSVS